MSDFTHLHCHTEYSFLDGAIRIESLCKRAVDFGFSAVSITDHGNLCGAIELYTTALKYGLKPIIGCEVYVAPEDRFKKEAKSSQDVGHHLVLLASNKEGYHNLIKLVTKGYLEGFYYKPRVDKSLLKEYNKGLIALSACLKGEIPETIIRKGKDKAIEVLKEYLAIFPDRFFLEIMDLEIPEQEKVNHVLLEFSEEFNVPVVATNDCHYLDPEDVEAHDVLLCIQTNSKVDDNKRWRFSTKKLYVRSFEEMEKAFSFAPQAIESVGRIIEMCNLEIELGKHRFPVYQLPDGKSAEEELKDKAFYGLKKRIEFIKKKYPINEKEYFDRLEYELDVICKKGFAPYFLIVQDFINWAKSQGIPVGPGRGSAAGSLVAYALGITNLDPIKYNLLFERFLNIERESLPDIDVDFCYNRREEVIEYVSDKYGKDKVAQIATFGKMKAKAVVRDVGRALGMSFSETDKIAKLIPESNISIEDAVKLEPELKKKIKEDEKVAKLIEISKKLEGLVRHSSTHAAGVVISDKPMDEYLPLFLGKNNEVVTQFDMKGVEKIGLIKFDFLGLKTLTVIYNTLELIKRNNKTPPNIEDLPLDDKKTFELLCRGDTDGIFQLESSGMKRLIVDLKPSSFEDIIALLALYRPGPLESGMVKQFVDRKHGREEIKYLHPSLEPILKTTYGVILYQEQVMRIAADLADYSLGDGDILRRAMGKKDPATMSKQRSKFVEGAKKKGIPEEIAHEIFDQMEKFAGYGFNKSHSAAYAMISYQTAYLKAHYPLEFMAALMSSEMNNQDKIIAYINSCREKGIKVEKPDINKSFKQFTVQGDKILFGLAAIKHIGESAIEEIIKERERGGPFKSLLDFCKRVNLRKVNKRALESLIKSGAMDCFNVPRMVMFESLDKVIAKAQREEKAKRQKRLSLIASASEKNKNINKELKGLGIDIEDVDLREWDEEEKLRYEKEYLGFFLSGHPLLKFKHLLPMLGVTTLKECSEISLDKNLDKEVKVAILFTSLKEINTSKGKMAFCGAEDLTGTSEIIIFPNLYEQLKGTIDFEQPYLCKAKITEEKVEVQEEESSEGVKKIKLIATELVKIKDLSYKDIPFDIELHINDLEKIEDFDELKSILSKHPGTSPVRLKIVSNGVICILRLGEEFDVFPDAGLVKDLTSWIENLKE